MFSSSDKHVDDHDRPSLTHLPQEEPLTRTWPAYAAAVVASLFAVVSFYWGAGGTALVSTLGGRIEALALARDPFLITAVWVTGFAKLAGAVLALALVRPWGRRLPRRWLRATAWAGAALLTAYGLVQVFSVALVAAGAITPDVPIDPSVLRWRLLLWEPWFLVWGLLLGLATWTTRRR